MYLPTQIAAINYNFNSYFNNNLFVKGAVLKHIKTFKYTMSHCILQIEKVILQ